MRLPRECYQMQQTISAYLPQLSQPQLTGLVLWVVYPRVCGGTLRLGQNPGPGAGLSPRVRGTDQCGSLSGFACGLSPRVRGNPQALDAHIARLRSIPACAGEPQPRSGENQLRRVYPRVCGGTHDYPGHQVIYQGLSPRVRGNPGLPAHAGASEGLSPRVRGNPQQQVVGLVGQGSIPACAGEPSTTSPLFATARVYPRVCGGTAMLRKRWRPRQGLSPRVRGNLTASRWSHSSAGSIPACAGEPLPFSQYWQRYGVYPRVCGGTVCGS